MKYFILVLFSLPLFYLLVLAVLVLAGVISPTEGNELLPIRRFDGGL